MKASPHSAVLLAARIARAYPALSAYSSATLAEGLCRVEKFQRTYATRACNGDYKTWKTRPAIREAGTDACYAVHDPNAEARAKKAVKTRVTGWLARLLDLAGTCCPQCQRKTDFDGRCSDSRCKFFGKDLCYVSKVYLEGDPRGAVLKVRFPGETEAVAV